MNNLSHLGKNARPVDSVVLSKSYAPFSFPNRSEATNDLIYLAHCSLGINVMDVTFDS